MVFPERMGRKTDLLSIAISLWSCAAILLVFVIFQKSLHWFLIPLSITGVLIGLDGVDWLRNKVDLLDPRGLLGLYGFYFFFLAPLLHVALDYWLSAPTTPNEWRDWLGWMSAANACGLLIYRQVRSVSSSPRRLMPERRLNPCVFWAVWSVAILVSIALQLFVYQQFGGIEGYIRGFEIGGEAFSGMGVVFMISESAPILAVLGWAVYVRERKRRVSWPVVILVLFLFLVFRILFGGLRGSRSNIIWALFWAAGIIHYWVRPLGKKMVYAGVTFLVLFMYAYGFYKTGGVQGLANLLTPADRVEYAINTRRTIAATLLGDLARSDIQAFILYRLSDNGSDYQPAYGRTYVGAISLMIPRAIWPERPPTKVKEGTEVQYGRGMWVQGVFESSRVYGLVGEAMLNFGYFGIPLAFAVLGYTVGRLRAYLSSLSNQDIRMLLIPLLVNACFVMLVGDSDNLVFFLLKNGLLPWVVVHLGSATRARDGRF